MLACEWGPEREWAHCCIKIRFLEISIAPVKLQRDKEKKPEVKEIKGNSKQ